MLNRELTVLHRWLDEQKSQLQPNVIAISDPSGTGDKFIQISHKWKKSMIDGKGRNAVSDNGSSQTCYLCHATPRAFNNLENFPTAFPTDQIC